MRGVEPYLFRTLRADVPDFLRTWRQTGAEARWDRHYLVKPGFSLSLHGGTAVELKRARAADGFRIEQNLLSAAFPLDWMSLSLLASALPKPFAGVELDGRSAQRFVDSLAYRELPQASVRKEIHTFETGAIVATAATVTVPDWNAATVALTFESFSASALRSLLSAGNFRTPHVDLDDWLREAHAAATAPAAPAAEAEAA